MFERTPIIVLGVNHSGTRLVVEILSRLGSDGGACDNLWRENKLFLAIHRELIAKVSDRGWDATIFDWRFIAAYDDDGRYVDLVTRRLAADLPHSYNAFPCRPWHWKCPTSVLFLRTWQTLYPQAYYVHVVRDPYAVARSFLRRRQLANPADALRLGAVVNRRIEAHAFARYVKIQFEKIEQEIERLVTFLPLNPTGAQVEHAKEAVAGHGRKLWGTLWPPKRCAREIVVAAKVLTARGMCGRDPATHLER
jgi:hypothetical protein